MNTNRKMTWLWEEAQTHFSWLLDIIEKFWANIVKLVITEWEHEKALSESIVLRRFELERMGTKEQIEYILALWVESILEVASEKLKSLDSWDTGWAIDIIKSVLASLDIDTISWKQLIELGLFLKHFQEIMLWKKIEWIDKVSTLNWSERNPEIIIRKRKKWVIKYIKDAIDENITNPGYYKAMWDDLIRIWSYIYVLEIYVTFNSLEKLKIIPVTIH